MIDPLRTQLQAALGAAYTVDRELSGGGMSRVFVVRDESLERDIVLKVLAPDLAAGLSAERFAREIKLTASLQEPHIVPLLAAGVIADGLPWYTMPFVRGESLRARLERGPVPLAEAVAILGNVAHALAYAHGRGVVHRDVKPENILLNEGTAVVTDFGIAKALSVSRTQAPGGTLTVMGTSLGTPAYMAPEQAAGDMVDHRADLYAWAVVAYELLSGRHPFAGKTTAQQLLAAHIAESPVPLVLDGRASLVAGVVMRCLMKDPAERPATAMALVEEMDAMNTGANDVTFLRGARHARTIAAVGLIVIVGAALAMYARASRQRPEPSPPPTTAAIARAGQPSRAITSVAVLPFDNTSGNPQDEYFSDGMTDELAHALARVPGMRLAGRSSSYTYKGRAVRAQEIGAALDVGAIVEGAVRRAGDRLRVTAQLTNTRDGKVMWDSVYESRSRDVFAVQDEFTRAIVASLAPTLRGQVAATAAGTSRGTTDQKAYDLYLRGSYFLARRGAANLERAVDQFKLAIGRDPKFARAHAGLAISLALLPSYAAVSTDSLLALALPSAQRALTLDSALSDAQLALGRVQTVLLRLPEAVASYRRALAIDPRNATGNQWLGNNLVIVGAVEEGVALARRAHEIDPLSAVIAGDQVEVLAASGRMDDALTEARRALELDPSFARNALKLAIVQVLRGSTDTAVGIAEAAYAATPDAPPAHAILAYTYAAAGRWLDADRVRAEFDRRQTQRLFHGEAAMLALVFGDRATALTELERSVAQHDLIFATRIPNCEPLFAPIATDPRFIALLHRMGGVRCPVPVRWPIPVRHER